MNTLDDSPERLAAANRALARRRALRRGDQGSPECVLFAPLAECRHCDDPLYHENRSPVHGVCQRCLEETVAMEQEAKHRRDAKLAKEASRTGWGAMSVIIPWVAMAMGAAVLLAWLLDKAAWAIGKWWGGA